MQAVSSYSPTGNPYIDGVLMGTKWALPNTLTFSFPTDPSLYGTYGSSEPTNGFKAFTATQQSAVRTILQMYSSVANLTFTEVTETSMQHADLRYAESNSPSTAWAYFPGTDPLSGDLWFSNSHHYYDTPVKGNYAWDTLIHETGHAVGLKHPHNVMGSFGAMPLDHDSIEYSVMSYRSFVGAGTSGYVNASDSFPQSLMMYDIAALQQLYGANYNTNSGNTVYTWSPTTGQEFINGVGQGAVLGNKIFMTTWDGGGNDTYDFSNYTTNVNVNLQPGQWTTVSTTQLANLGGGHVAAGNIANSLLYNNNPASLIENAIGGSGNDTIIGNDADNRLTGGGGNDKLVGGSGNDTAVYSGQSTDYQIVQNSDGSWSVTDLRAGHADGVDTLSFIEQLQFIDKTVSLSSLASSSPTLQIPVVNAISNDSGTAGDGVTNATAFSLTGSATAGSVVDVYDGTTRLGSVTADTNGSWTFATTNLVNGVHSFTTVGSDASGATSAPSPVFAVTVDTVAPVAPQITSFSPDTATVGDNKTSANAITLQGTAEAGSTVYIHDGAVTLASVTADATGAWSYSTYNPQSIAPAFTDPDDDPAHADGAPQRGAGSAPLADGLHNFYVVAQDLAGNASATSAVFGITVDTIAPNAPIIGGFSADSGVVGDGITNAKMIKFVGTAEFGSTVKLYDGATLVGSGITTSSGIGSWNVYTAALKNGAHTITAVSTDATGNVGTASATFNIVVDTTAPNAPIISSFGSDTGLLGDHITSVHALTLSGSVEAGSKIAVYDGAVLLGNATADSGGTWSYVTDALADGTHSLTATAADVADNTGAASSAYSVTIDSTAPAVPSIASFGNDTGTVGDGVTSARMLNLTGAAEAGSTVKIYDGATLLGSAVANGSGAWSYTTGSLADGIHNLTATAIDVAGNSSSASASVNVTVDGTAPVAPAIASFGPDTGVARDGVTAAQALNLVGTAEAGSTVKVYDGAIVLGTAIANGSGAWSYTTAPLADGAHNLTATAVDTAGNAGVASASLAITIDSTAPGAPAITSFSDDTDVPGDGITRDSTLTLAGSAEVGSTVKVYDGATLLGSAVANAGGAWNYTTSTLTDGAHSLTATATDVAGNTGGGSLALNVVVESVVAAVPTITSFGADTGTPGDGITSAKVLNLAGTADSGSTVHIYDGATLLGSAAADAGGSWTYTTASLADGVHSLTATATDASGNTGASSPALDVTVDGTAPGAPVIGSFGNDTGVASDGVTAAHVLNLVGTAEAGSTVQIYDGATLLGSAMANAGGAWNYTTGSLADGTHSLTATATDTAGNIGTSSSAVDVTVDGLAPATPAIASFGPDSGVVGDHLTSAKVLNLAGTAEAGSTVKLYDGATLLGSATADGSGAWSYTTGSLADGAHSLTATATDVAGNTGAVSSVLNVAIDSTAPGLPTIASFATDSGVPSDGTTSAKVLTLTGSAEAGSTVKLFDGATLLGSATANSDGTWSYVTASMADGAHNFTATATDAAGNTGAASGALHVMVDSTAPDAPVIGSLDADTGLPIGGVTTAQAFNLSGTAEAGSTVAVYDGATLLSTTLADGSGAWSLATGHLDQGVHNLTATAADAAGNTGAVSAALNVTVDSLGPATPVITAFGADTGTSGDDVTNVQVLNIVGTAEAGSNVTIYDGVSLLGSTTTNGGGAWSYTSGSLADGVHTLTATATDGAGNTGAASEVLSVTIDSTAPLTPVISAFGADTGVPGDDIVRVKVLDLTGTAEAGSVVKLYDGATLLGSVAANGSGTWSYTTGPLADGVHILTATSTDAAGNTGHASSALNIKIDTTAPIAPSVASYALDGGATAALVGATVLDLVGAAEAGSAVQFYDGATLLGSVTADSNGNWSYKTNSLANGAHHLTAIATDIADNTGVASAALNLTTTVQNIAAAGQPAQMSYTVVNADGSKEVLISGITGQKWTSTDTLYDVNSKAVSEIWSNSANLVKTQTWNPDGSTRDIHYYGITGQSFTDYDVVYGANNKQAIVTYSNGVMTTWSYNADGSTHDLHYYGIAGQDYTDYDVVYGSNAKSVSATYSNGMTQSWTYNGDGSLYETVVNGITGQAWTTTDTIYGANGKAASEVWSTGATLVRSQTWNADGTTHDIHYYGITGQLYTDYDVVYDDNHKMASATYSNGMTQTWSYNADGSYQFAYDHVQGNCYTSSVSFYDPNFGTNKMAAYEMIGTNGIETVRGYENGLTIMKGADGAGVKLAIPSNDVFNFAFNANTIMTGGGINENFLLKSGFGNVMITDFIAHSLPNTNHDTITFGVGLFSDFADLQNHMSQDGAGNTVINTGHGDVLTLNHTLTANLHANDFILLT